MTGIIIIFYNNTDFLLRQHEHLSLFMKDGYKLIVVDNSSDEHIAAGMKHHAGEMGLEYVRTKATSKNGSDSHAFALCFAYQKYAKQFEQILVLDHDAFLIKPFSVTETLAKRLIAGLGQVRDGEKYFWPGCCMFKRGVPMDFSISRGKDTGGNTSKAIQSVGEDNCQFFDEAYAQNEAFNKSQYNFYALIHNGTFLHFINGSNWAGSADNEERLNSLFNVLENYKNVAIQAKKED
jgi:hypothetical protein